MGDEIAPDKDKRGNVIGRIISDSVTQDGMADRRRPTANGEIAITQPQIVGYFC